MKKNYEELELKVIRFASEDVITASGEQTCPPIAICTDKAIPCLQCTGNQCRLVECVDMICKRLDCMERCEM